MKHKNEPYQTEEEALNCPLYTAQNKHLIKPIREDWKLYTVCLEEPEEVPQDDGRVYEPYTKAFYDLY